MAWQLMQVQTVTSTVRRLAVESTVSSCLHKQESPILEKLCVLIWHWLVEWAIEIAVYYIRIQMAWKQFYGMRTVLPMLLILISSRFLWAIMVTQSSDVST